MFRFYSVVEAGSYPEPVDVSEGIYRNYDAEGRLLRIEAEGGSVRTSVPPRAVRVTPASWGKC